MGHDPGFILIDSICYDASHPAQFTENYTDANTFNGFRFFEIREAAEGFDAIRHQHHIWTRTS